MIDINNLSLGTHEIPLVTHTEAVRYPISEAQLEVWLSSQQSADANCAYNEIATLELLGPLNRQAILGAIQTVYRRHGSLRITFDPQGKEVIEHPYRSIKVEEFNWEGNSSSQIKLLRKDLIANLGSAPFDLQSGPLFRAVLQRESSEKHFLTLVAHHLTLDGWSLSLIVKDLALAYDNLNEGRTENDTRALSYRDYAEAMRLYADSQEGKEDLNYWLGQFADEVPVLNLPLSGNRRPLRTYHASRIEHVLPSTLVASVRKLGAKNGCSLYNTVLAAFQAFVARLGQTNDIVLAIPTAGQSAMNLQDVVGHCVNTLPVRIQIDKKNLFSEHLKRSRSGLLSGLDHQRLSYGTLLKYIKLERDPSRPPLCAISFNLDPMIDLKASGFRGLTVDLHVEPRAFEHFEWFVNGIIHSDQSIELQVQFNRDLFQNDYIKHYFEGFQAFLESLVANPQLEIGRIPMMSLRQRQEMMVDWNSTQLDYPKHSSLPAELSRQALATPNAIAVRSGDKQLSYRQLDEQSSEFSKFLTLAGIQRGDLVGICSHRSPQLLVQILGILKAGAGYVPLDPMYPVDRLRHMCDDSQLKLIVTEDKLEELASQFGKPIVLFDGLNSSHRSSLQLNDNSTCKTTDSLPEIAPSDTCYVIYTSGSTGKPKGVMVPHGAVVNFLYSMKQQPGYDPQENVLAITTLSFDIAVLELYLPLLFGGTVTIADRETATDGKKLIEILERENIHLMQATPATWRMMISAGWEGKKGLKVLCGGEPMPLELVEPLLARCSELWNMYGPTETTVWSTALRIHSADSTILIGRPIGNTQIYLLDSQGEEVPVGVEGEVMIAGAGVTKGYWNRPDLTAERFADNPYFNPFEDYINHRLYRTGDIAVYRMDGNIEYRRRNDKQIKLRGFRIELGEIEAAILDDQGIAQAVVIVRNDHANDPKLIAYLTKRDDKDLSIENLRERLRSTLPQYMIPQSFVILSAMPLTENGKVNVKALPVPDSQSQPTDDAPCVTSAEKFLGEIWKRCLRLDRISRNDNFFDAGGHSLLVMQVIHEVEQKTKIRLSPHEFLMGTLEHLAIQLESSEEMLPVEAANAAAFHNEFSISDEPKQSKSSPFDLLKRFWR